MQDSDSDLKYVVTQIIGLLADKPSAVVVSEAVNSGVHCVSVYVDEGDFARFAAHGGRTLRALETVVTALARKQGKSIALEVIGDSDSSRTN